MNINNIKGAIFDLDGTLFDSMWVWTYVDTEFLKKRNIKADDEYIKALGPMGFQRAAEYSKTRFNLPETTEEILLEWFGLAKDAYDNKIELKDGAKEYLEYLYKKGVKLGIATSNHPELCQGALKRFGIYDMFSSFTLTAEVENGKACPDVYLLCAERLGTAPQETAVFEDIAVGLNGAKKGGFITVGVKEETSLDDEEEIKKVSDIYIESFKELII